MDASSGSLTVPEPLTIVWNNDDLLEVLRREEQFIIENMSTITVDPAVTMEKLKRLCKVLETTKCVKKIVVKQLLASEEAEYWVDLLSVNESIIDFHFSVHDENDAGAIKRIINALNTKKRRTVKFIRSETISISSFVSLLRSAPVVSAEKFSVVMNLYQKIQISEANMIVELLKETKVNRFQLIDAAIFGNGTHPVEPLKLITNYLASHQIITAIRLHCQVFAESNADIVNIVENLHSLREFKLSMHIFPQPLVSDLFDAISTSQLRVLQLAAEPLTVLRDEFYNLLAGLLQKNKTIEKFTLIMCKASTIGLNCREICKALKTNEKITKWHMYQHYYRPNQQLLRKNRYISTEAGKYLVDAMQHNESVIDLLVDYEFIGSEDNLKLIELTNRNRAIQNNRVAGVITLFFNISLDRSAAVATFPLEIWTLIFSYLIIPGVSLDLGPIFSSVLNNHSIRRVIDM